MDINKLEKLKKYLLLISIVFFCVSFWHLLYSYFYSDSKFTPVSGWNMYEGLVGNFPSLNPLKKDTTNNQYIVSLLYRSLLRYDIEQQKILGDIAQCDISSLSKIECYINDNIFWSNGETITASDVLATYKVIQNTSVNPSVKQILDNTEITSRENTIVFENSTRDVNFMNALFQPIVSEEIISSLNESELLGDFKTTGWIYSGPFVLQNVKSDRTKGFTDIVFDKNIQYKQSNVSIDKLTIKIFPNTNSLLKNKESIHVFNDKNNIIWDSVPRFQNFSYTLPQFVGLFINTQNITNKNLRTFILNTTNRDNLLNIIGNSSYAKVNNPYMTDLDIKQEGLDTSFWEIMKSLWYQKKAQILDDFLPSKKVYSEEVNIIKSDADYKDEVSKLEYSLDDFQKDSEIIVSPEYVDIYNFITKDNILLSGKAPVGTSAVYINDYKLRSFTAGSQNFYYRIKVSNNNLTQGTNSYKIYFEENWKKVLQEEIFFLYNPSKNELNKLQSAFIDSLAIANLKQEDEERKNNIQQETQTVEVNSDTLNTITKLEDNWYYNDKKEPFELSLAYISNETYLEQTALYIKRSLESLGIKIQLKPLRLNEVAKLRQNKDSYDIFLGGINTGYFKDNIFAYFHSSQAEVGNNFSNFKKTSLDILLEDMKSKILTDQDKAEYQEKVLAILQKEQIVKTLFTPKIPLLIDKNIKSTYNFDVLANMKWRSRIFSSSYTKQKREINMDNKTISGFFIFLFNKLYE